MQNHPETPTVLVVDDNEANRTLARHTLEDEGFRVVLASDGAAGVEAFAREHPQCVLLDVRMQGMDGFATYEKIRALPNGAETPIAFLTALRDVDTFDRAIRLGGTDFLTKPVQPTELVLRVQAMLKLRRLSAELRDHYELMKSQRDAMQRLQLQKERLMAFVVHDLKNPVSSMDLHAQFLLREKGLPDSVRDAARQMRADAAQLTRMISNLLDLSRADEGLLEPRRAPIDLGALSAAVAAELEMQARSRDVSLSCEVGSVTIEADESLVRRLVANLVENAIRHSPTKSTVTLSATAGDDGVTLRVADEGSGVPEAMRERIFDAFVQAEAASERRPSRVGHGLGLAFCKAAAVAHGGEIWVAPSTEGATFAVRFP